VNSLTATSHRYFMSVAESRSIREAADRLRISQSAISRQIQNLELAMDCTLFDRNARGVVLTPAGRVLLRHLRDTKELSQRLKRDLDELKGIQRGHLVVGAVEGFAANGFPDVLTRFTSDHPEVTLEVLVEGTGSIIDGVLSGDHQIGIVYNPRAIGISVVAQARIPLSALMAPDHALATREKVRFAELLDYPLAVPAGKGGSREVFEAAAATARLPINPVLMSNSAHVIQAFLGVSDGVAIASAHSAAPYLRAGNIVAVPLHEEHLFSGTLAVIVNPELPMSSAGEILLSMLNKALGQLPEPGS
jgi:Transcriptional regulator